MLGLSCRGRGRGAQGVPWQWLCWPQLTQFPSQPVSCVAQQPWRQQGLAVGGIGQGAVLSSPSGSPGSARAGVVSAGTALLGEFCAEPCCPGCSGM